MQIHTTKENQTLDAIADQYGVREELLRNINEIPVGQPTEGEELLIILPTRDYKVQYGDTPERISLRFDIPKGGLHLQNPWIANRKLNTGETLTVKCSQVSGGMAAANGYFYKGCTNEKLNTALPYLTYVTFVSSVWNGKEIKKIFDDTKQVKAVTEAGKTPLLRICIDGINTKDLPRAKEIIEHTKSGEYKGIVLSTCNRENSASDFTSFLVDLRKLMIGCDLILITEIDEHSPGEFSEYADGSMIYYPKYAFESPKDFDLAERKILSDFALEKESAKAFIDLPSVAKAKGKYVDVCDAILRARRQKYPIEHNNNTLLSHFRDGKQGDVVFCSLRYLKEIFDLISELDYMGVCFDIMRTPLSHLLMYSRIFKSSYGVTVRSREGCSRADEE